MASNQRLFYAPGEAPHVLSNLFLRNMSLNEKRQTVAGPETEPRTQNVEIGFDPCQAKHFDTLQLDIKKWNAEHKATMKKHTMKQYDFRLNSEEMILYKKNGFVVSERLASPSFGMAYYRTYSDNLPVFITADSILHAWHKTFDDILSTFEEQVLSKKLGLVLTKLRLSIPGLMGKYLDTFLEESICDLDFFVSVAEKLLNESCVQEHESDKSPAELANDEFWKKYPMSRPPRLCKKDKDQVKDHPMDTSNKPIREMVRNVENATGSGKVLGSDRLIDFTLFKTRGHYTKSLNLRRYFKAAMWCGHVDLLIASPMYPPGSKEETESLQQLGMALLMSSILHDDANWLEMDSFLKKLIGITDSMTVVQMMKLAGDCGISSLDQVSSRQTLKAFQDKILAGDYGQQRISGHQSVFLDSSMSVPLPRSLTLLGQKFVLDSWVMSNLVHDRLKSQDGTKINRRIPSCLDVAYSVFDNPVARGFVYDRMERRPGYMRFRDGMDYSFALEAMRTAVSDLSEAEWSNSVYMRWLNMLRSLSGPVISGVKPSLVVPSTFRTDAWKQRLLNTQLASWTELRHDTILYVKQGSTCTSACEYPDGYVEPNPLFWDRFYGMVKSMSDLMEANGFGRNEVELASKRCNSVESDDDSKKIKALDTLSRIERVWLPVLEKLRSISHKQAENIPLTDFKYLDYYNDIYEKLTGISEVEFLKTVMEESHGSGASMFMGWYPKLFLKNAIDCCKPDEGIVCDVHTDPCDEDSGDPGCILHEGISSKVNTMIVAVPDVSGTGSICYVGPVLDHYEFCTPVDQRLNDTEWLKMCDSGNCPEHPVWTKDWLVPGVTVAPIPV